MLLRKVFGCILVNIFVNIVICEEVNKPETNSHPLERPHQIQRQLSQDYEENNMDDQQMNMFSDYIDRGFESRRIENDPLSSSLPFPFSPQKSKRNNKKRKQSIGSPPNDFYGYGYDPYYPYYPYPMMMDPGLMNPMMSNEIPPGFAIPDPTLYYYTPHLSEADLTNENGDVTSVGFPIALYEPPEFLHSVGNDTDFNSTTTESPNNSTTTENPDLKDDDDDEDDNSTTEPTTTTTLAPFKLSDVKVPIPFLRIEYMISFTFLGLMYGLGFFVLFQSLCVPAAKIAVTIVYLILLKLNAIDPISLEKALEQLPPT